ncbi:MAG: MoaD/ThiS family protein [Ignavibacteriales bacterium]
MKIYYKAIGELRRKISCSEGEVECAKGTTAANLIDKLGLENKGLVIMVNGRKVGSEEPLNEDDRITLIPVAIGG